MIGRVDDAIMMQDDGTPDANYVVIKCSNLHDCARAIVAASTGPEHPGEDEVTRMLHEWSTSGIPNDMPLDKIRFTDDVNAPPTNSHGQWRDVACHKKWATVRARRFKADSEKIGGFSGGTGGSYDFGAAGGAGGGRQGIFMPGSGPLTAAGGGGPSQARGEKPPIPRSETDASHRKLLIRKNMDGHTEIAFPTLLIYRDGEIDVNTIFQNAYKKNFNRYTPVMRTCVIMGTTGKPYQPMFVDMHPNPDAPTFTIYNVHGVTKAGAAGGGAGGGAGGEMEVEPVVLEDAAELPSVGGAHGFTHIEFGESFDRASVRMHMVGGPRL